MSWVNQLGRTAQHESQLEHGLLDLFGGFGAFISVPELALLKVSQQVSRETMELMADKMLFAMKKTEHSNLLTMEIGNAIIPESFDILPVALRPICTTLFKCLTAADLGTALAKLSAPALDAAVERLRPRSFAFRDVEVMRITVDCGGYWNEAEMCAVWRAVEPSILAVVSSSAHLQGLQLVVRSTRRLVGREPVNPELNKIMWKGRENRRLFEKRIGKLEEAEVIHLP